MTLKQRAALDIAKMFLGGAAVGSIVALSVQYLGIVITGIVVTSGLLVYLTKMAYDMRVSQLQLEADRIERALRDTK